MHVPGDSEERQPTLRGTTSHAPSETLLRIASSLGVPVSSLSTLSVLHSTSTLYTAVLEYAALSGPPSGSLDVAVPLFVDSFEERRDDDDDDSDDGDSLARAFSSMPRFRRRSRSTVQAGQGLRQRRVPIPKFKLGLGETSFVWPPPPHLSADYLAEMHELKRKPKHSQVYDATDGKKESLTDDHPPMAPDDKSSETASPNDVSEKRGVIYISHYSVGEPRYAEMSGLTTYREILMVSAEGPQFLRDFAKEVIRWRSDKDYFETDGSKFALYRFKTDSCGSGWWQSEGMKRARPPASVILPEGQMESILSDVRNFIKPETRKWYISHGLPHRRSYLFFGPPGTGKTSTIRAIGSTFRLNCCFLSMTTAGFSNQCLGDALSQIPGNALIVLEDVDALFNEDRKNEQGASLTFSGLLNALDGLISTDGVITIMTTNFIDKLDKALIRGGRVDRRFLFARPTHSQIKDLFLSFYPDASKGTLHEFLDAVLCRTEGEEARSIATLQQLFIDQRENTAEECVRSIPSFFERHFPAGTGTANGSLYT